jgi:hypothetical protein
MIDSFNSEVLLANGGSDEKRLFQFARLKPPAGIYFPRRLFIYPPKALSGKNRRMAVRQIFIVRRQPQK